MGSMSVRVLVIKKRAVFDFDSFADACRKLGLKYRTTLKDVKKRPHGIHDDRFEFRLRGDDRPWTTDLSDRNGKVRRVGVKVNADRMCYFRSVYEVTKRYGMSDSTIRTYAKTGKRYKGKYKFKLYY